MLEYFQNTGFITCKLDSHFQMWYYHFILRRSLYLWPF